MEWKDFIAVVLVVFLSLWGMLYLESDLTSFFMLELLAILLFIIIASGILYGVASEKDWAWSALTAFFALASINTVLVFLLTKNTTPFMLTLFVNIIGFAGCGAKAVNFEFPQETPSPREEGIPDLPPMPVYHIDESDLISHVEAEPMEIETYTEEPARNAPKPTIKKVAGKKKIARSANSPNSNKNLAKPGKKKSKKKKR